jgi:Ca-activated chloride channel family protein
LKRKIIAPWIVATTISIFVIAAVGTGFYFLVRTTCSGSVEATIVASPSTASILESLSRTWSEDQPAVAGKCAKIEVKTRDSSATVEALGQGWTSKSSGAAPDAWVPDSSIWVWHASSNAIVAAMMPKRQPSLARSPSVIAMPRPMAEALGWPKTMVSWPRLISELATSPDGWGGFGKPDWGMIRVGMSDPAKSTAALLALVTLTTPENQAEPSQDGLAALTKLKEIKAGYAPSTDDLFNDLTKADSQDAASALAYLSAFPALETDVLAYNLRTPRLPLAAMYPQGARDADNPYLVLRAPWSDPTKQRVAEDFLKYLQSPQARAAFRDAGFRDARRSGGEDLAEENGLLPKPPAEPEGVLPSQAVGESLAAWGA